VLFIIDTEYFLRRKVSIHNLDYFIEDVSKITYSKAQNDYAIVLITEVVNNDFFSKVVANKNVCIIFLQSVCWCECRHL